MRIAHPNTLSGRSERAVAEAIAATAARMERIISLTRLLFFSALIIRFLWIAHVGLLPRLFTIMPLAIGIAFSVCILFFVRRPPGGEGVYLASVTVDAMAAFGALLPNVLWPGQGNPGILFMPDTAGILVATVAAGLRLSPRVAGVGGVANLLTLTALTVLDRLSGGVRWEVSAGPYTIYVLYVAACGGLAVILSLLVRRLTREGALAATRADQAEQGLGTLLAESHDLRSLLASATVNADLLFTSLEHPAKDLVPSKLAALSRHLVDNLKDMGNILLDLSCRALGDLTALGMRMPVEPKGSLHRVVEHLRPRFPEVEFRLARPDTGVHLLVAGGEPTLVRILLNLVKNACEGDGTVQASSVTFDLRVESANRVARLTIEDDGPGIDDRVLTGQRVLASTKPVGLGLGLTVARGLAEASGGHLNLENRLGGGARATVVLPLVTGG